MQDQCNRRYFNMKKYTTVSLFILALFLTSCQNKIDDSCITLELKPVIESDPAFPFDIIKNITYIPLETNENSFLTDIFNRVELYDNQLYVLNFETDIKVFDKSGTFLRAIGKRGNGPQEYINLMDFAVNKEKGELFLNGLGKLLTTTLSGDFIDESPLSLSLQTMAYYDNMFMFPYTTSNKEYLFQILKIDEKGKVCDTIDYPSRYEGTIIPYFMSVSSNETGFFLKHELSNEMLRFSISEEDGDLEETIIAVTDFGNYTVKPEYFQFENFDKLEASYHIERFYNNERYIALNIHKGFMEPVLFSYIYDKKNKTFYKLEMDSIPMITVKMDNNTLIAIIDPILLSDNKTNITDKKLRELAYNIDEESNPVIALIELK